MALVAAADLIGKTRLALADLGVEANDSLLVGVSGGPDSIALADALWRLKKKGAVANLMIAHVNHSLRAEADSDEALVRSFAAERQIPIEVMRIDTAAVARDKKKGIEETARNIRYAFFRELAEQHKITHVVTAHTANDQAETVIMHAIRGAGVRGLAGIPSRRMLIPPPKEGRGKGVIIIRPWLEIERSEINTYITEHTLRVAHDVSNSDPSYTRNRVRHRVIPALEAAYPERDPVQALARLAARMASLDKFLTALTSEKLETSMLPSGAIPLAAMRNMHGVPLHGFLEAWIAKVAGHYRLTEQELRKIERFFASSARRVELRNGVALVKKKELSGPVLAVVKV